MIDYHLADYIELVDWTGRAIRHDKRGAIDAALPPILRRLGLAPEAWLESARHFRKQFSLAVGPVGALERYCRQLGGHWLRGKRACALLYLDPVPA